MAEVKTPGVTWSKCFQQWRAQIYRNGQKKYLGYFNTREEALAARAAGQASKDNENANVRLRPCLRCEEKFLTPPELRICEKCKNPALSWAQREGGFDYNPTITKPVNTRGGYE